METDNRIGVLHVISGLGLGGAERMLLWSARYHDRSRFRMGVVSIMSGGELAEEIRREEVDVFELGQSRGRLSIPTCRKFMRIIRDFEPGILQGHMFHSNLLVRLAGTLKKQTVVLCTRHIDLAPPLRRLVNGLTGFLSDGTLVFSPRVLDEERRENFFRRPIKMVHYGIEIPARSTAARRLAGRSEGQGLRELRKELHIPSEAFLWTAVGRLTRQKGFSFLIDAFSKVADLPGGSFLLIIGDGEEREMLRERAKNTGIEQRVIFPGAMTDAFPVLVVSDAFVLSSLWEGGPLVILEAMAAGLPVVSTRVGDASSMVQEGITGTLVEAGEPDQLAGAMNRVQDMGSEAGDWGVSGRRRVEELYDFKRVQREMEIYYRELAG